MTLTTAKWTLDDYHRMIEVGLLDNRHVDTRQLTLTTGEIQPLAFPDVTISVQRLLES